MAALAIVVSALIGLVFSSYLHVLIARTPMHLPLRSVDLHCSNCGTAVAKGQRNALIARLRNNHRCANCNQSLWPDSPWIEIFTTCLFAIVGWRLGWHPAIAAYWVFFLAAVVIVVVDYRHYIIPTRVVYPTALAGLALLLASAVIGGDLDQFRNAFVMMLVCWFFYYLCFLFFPSGMGFGDVRLALLIGLFAGYLGVGNALWAILLGLFLGAGIGLLLVVVRIRKLKSHIPFGPFMVLGASIAILFGSALFSS